MKTIELRDQLTRLLSGIPEIVGIGQTGDIHAPLVPGKSDIDLFVICRLVPDSSERSRLYAQLEPWTDSLEMEVSRGGIWGHGDVFLSGGIDVMPMYFTEAEMRLYLEEVLSGRHPGKEGRFYPVGRLASIESLNVLWERDGAWTNMIRRVKEHPEAFFRMWYRNEAACILDEEDLGRAELRCEVLFFHQVVEEFMDHFLQALYALNRRYFPSRKRTEEAIAQFSLKPENCCMRMKRILTLAACADTVPKAVTEIRKLGTELLEIPFDRDGKA